MAQQTRGVPSAEGSVPESPRRAGARAFGSAGEEGRNSDGTVSAAAPTQ